MSAQATIDLGWALSENLRTARLALFGQSLGPEGLWTSSRARYCGLESWGTSAAKASPSRQGCLP